jgi:hypothetical protein
MNNIQIDTALRSEKICRDIYVGTFSADTLPLKEYPGAYIANTDTSSQPGQHWVAFYCEKEKQIEVFDSYGYNPAVYSPYLKNWIGSDYVIQSTCKLQGPDSTVCGQYCMFFVLLRCHGFSYEYVISTLSRHTEYNDRFVCKFINKYFKLRTSVQDAVFIIKTLLKNGKHG